MKKILVIDDEKNVHYSFKRVFRDLEILSALSAEEGREILAQNPDVELILADIKMPGITGIELMESLKEEGSQIPIIIITAHGSLENAIQAVQKGAYDYLIKPFDFHKLKSAVYHALEITEKKVEKKLETPKEKFLIGNSPVMQDIYREIARVALKDVTVLITGESGTGKERVAKAIHHYSPRKTGPFIAVNCGAIPSDLMESELFGYEKGAFTGAHKKTSGKFEQAHGGTLFLDEIGELPLNLQVKILRAIQEMEITPLGSSHSLRVDVRIVTATNRDLKEEIRKTNFREDLYYRLNVFPIHLPALRARKEDIPLLSQYFIENINSHHKMKIRGLSDSAQEKLLTYDFPGNIRELENIITRSALSAHSDVIESEDIDLGGSEEVFLTRIEKNMENIIQLIFDKGIPAHELTERVLLSTLLKKFDYNQTRTAEYLNINRNTLRKKLKDHQIL
jgi:two-component system nitrogen regulation response regulator GlnG